MQIYLIFGAGEVGIKTKAKLEAEGNIISGFLDNDKEKWNTSFEDLTVYSPDNISELRYDRIAIGMYKAAPLIRKQLREMGIAEEKICVPIEPTRLYYNSSIPFEGHLPDENEMSSTTKSFLEKRIELNDMEFLDKLTDLKHVLVNYNIPLQNVCVCSGAVLQAYGLRQSKKFDDIDVIMTSDYRNIYGKGLVIISETAEMHPMDEYDITDDEIISNPDRHFWFHGLKFMNLDILYRQREKKGVNDELKLIKTVLKSE